MEYKDESCASGGGGIGSVPKTKAHLKQLGIPDRKRTIPLYVFQVFPHYIIAVFNSPAGGGGGGLDISLDGEVRRGPSYPDPV